jgi:hypothetical protein
MRQQRLEEENRRLQECIKALIHSYNQIIAPEETPPERTIAGMPISKATSDILDEWEKIEKADDLSKLDGE